MPPDPATRAGAPLVVLGATGSIGAQTLDVAERLGFDVLGLAARRASVAATLAEIEDEMPTTVEQVLAADDEARRIAASHVASETGGGGDA